MEWIPVFFIGLSVCWFGLKAKELFSAESPSRLQRLLGCIFVWWGLSTLKDLLYCTRLFDEVQLLRHIYFLDGCGVVTFTLLLFELSMPGWVTRRRTALLLAPFMVFLVLHFFFHQPWFNKLFNYFLVTFAWGSVLIAGYKTRAYAHTIRQNYSDLEDVDISWMWYIIVAFALCLHIWWAVADDFSLLAAAFFYASVLVCWHFTLRCINRMRPLRLPTTEPALANDNPDSREEQEKTPQATRKRTGITAGRLEQLMDDEQLYLNPDLTMADLTARLGTNRTYLSEYLSTELNTTFYDYVNRLRIERCVLPLMESDRNLTLEHIATEAGFKSITTFRRAFRKLTGQLPSEFLRH